MIEVGTKLKSVKNGSIVEVIKRDAESFLVRAADNTEKKLSASTVARWYDEITEPVNKKETVVATHTPVVKASKSNVKKSTKKETPFERVEQLAQDLREHLKKIGCTIIEQVAYRKIASKSGEILAHIWFLKRRVRIYFKESKLQDVDKGWMVKLPKSVSTVYTYAVEVEDPTLMKRCLDLFDRING